jgi:hypothetical protein
MIGRPVFEPRTAVPTLGTRARDFFEAVMAEVYRDFRRPPQLLLPSSRTRSYVGGPPYHALPNAFARQGLAPTQAALLYRLTSIASALA